MASIYECIEIFYNQTLPFAFGLSVPQSLRILESGSLTRCLFFLGKFKSFLYFKAFIQIYVQVFFQIVSIMSCKNHTKFKFSIQENVNMIRFQLVNLNTRIADQKYLTIYVKKCAIL